MFVIPVLDNELFYLKVIIALLLLVSLYPSFLFPKAPTGSQRHVDINFQIHQAIIPSAPLVWFLLSLPFLFFLGPPFWSTLSFFSSLDVALFAALTTGRLFSLLTFLHPSSAVGPLCPGSSVFLCFVLHHCFPGAHPAVKPECMHRGSQLGACPSRRSLYFAFISDS